MRYESPRAKHYIFSSWEMGPISKWDLCEKWLPKKFSLFLLISQCLKLRSLSEISVRDLTIYFFLRSNYNLWYPIIRSHKDLIMRWLPFLKMRLLWDLMKLLDLSETHWDQKSVLRFHEIKKHFLRTKYAKMKKKS